MNIIVSDYVNIENGVLVCIDASMQLSRVNATNELVTILQLFGDGIQFHAVFKNNEDLIVAHAEITNYLVSQSKPKRGLLSRLGLA